MEVFKNILLLLGIIVGWYLLGFTLLLVICAYGEGEIKVKDIKDIMPVALFGPIVVVGVIGFHLIDLYEKLKNFLTTKEHVVLWRSRKNKNKHILFGKNNDKS